MAGNRPPRRPDLARGNAAGLDRFHAVGAEIERRAALGHAVDAALVGFAVLGALGGEHDLIPVAIAVAAAARAAVYAGGQRLAEQLVLRHRVMREDLALDHPHLDPAGAVGSLL